MRLQMTKTALAVAGAFALSMATPPRGGNAAPSSEEIRAVVEYMRKAFAP